VTFEESRGELRRVDEAFYLPSIMNSEVKSALKILQDMVDASKLRNGLKLVGFFFLERGWCSAISLPKTIFPGTVPLIILYVFILLFLFNLCNYLFYFILFISRRGCLTLTLWSLFF
jgi:hypothetical protein